MKKYLVGLLCGGLMESPKVYFSGPYEIIEAKSKEEAKQAYNTKHNCSYFYGSVMCELRFVGKHILILNINENCSSGECKNILSYMMI